MVCISIRKAAMNPVKKQKSLWPGAIAAIGLFISPVLLPDEFLQPAIENEFIRDVRSKLDDYRRVLPEERIYLSTDKPLFAPGEDIWFSVFVRDGVNMKPSSQSDIVHADLIGPKGNVEQSLTLIAKKGRAAGDFSLNQELPGGIYMIRAYTNWMKNETEDNCFEKEIQVQEVVLPTLKMKLDFTKQGYRAGDEVFSKLEVFTNENKPLAGQVVKYVCSSGGKSIAEGTARIENDGQQFIRLQLPANLPANEALLNILIEYNGTTESISRAVPVLDSKLRLDFMPEGGDLVSGLPSRVAFRGVDGHQKPIDTEGSIYDHAGRKITSFSSAHKGMGAFAMVPANGETYYALVSKPSGISEKFELPRVLAHGYVMNVQQSGREKLAVTIHSSEQAQLPFVAQVRGKMYYSTLIEARKGENRLEFSTRGFPSGVAQLTLFDETGIPRSERLAFVNHERRMKIEMRTDKEQYLPREKVRLSVSTTDENGTPVPAALCISAVNDQLLSFADDRSGHLLSQFMLQQDLREKVEEPSFYFSGEKNAAQALDHLLMTSGWRRFSWEKLLEEDLPQITYAPEKAIIAGVVLDGNSGSAVNDALVTCANGFQKKQVRTDKDGKFSLAGFDLSEPATLKCEGNRSHSMVVDTYSDDLTVSVYDQHRRWMEHKAFAMDLAPQAATGANHRVVPEQEADARQKNAVKRKEQVHAPRPEKRREVAAKVAMAEDLEIADRLFEPRAAQQPVVSKYYRARQFPAPAYKPDEKPEFRDDTRSTIFWSPIVETGYSGKQTFEFFTSDQVTSFRIVAEGLSGNGLAGRSEKTIHSQLPFALSIKLPAEFVAGDQAQAALILKNNTPRPVGGNLDVCLPSGFELKNRIVKVQTMLPDEVRMIPLEFEVPDSIGTHMITVSFSACAMSDGVSREIRVISRGFEAPLSFSGDGRDQEFTFELKNTVPGSLRATVTAFPDVVSDLLTGVEGILREPNGCFEQTSCTAYPNAMVLNYLKATGSNDARLLANAGGLLDRGYKRLVTFETPVKGYEWFGSAPAHEGLTAYGVMEFTDMKRAGQLVDQQMLDRTIMWLLSHRDGKGGFQREQRALHDFGRVDADVMNAYIVYGLAEAGCQDIEREFTAACEVAVQKNDPYLLALAANAAFALNKDAKARQILARLAEKKEKNGSYQGTSHSITYSQGRSLTIETTALALLAMLKDPEKNLEEITRTAQFLVTSRDGSGTFGSTQATILALKALSEYAILSKRASADGKLVVSVDGKRVATRGFKAGERGPITIIGLEKNLSDGRKHTMSIRFEGDGKGLPYTVSVERNTTLPDNSEHCALSISTRLLNPQVRVGETSQLLVNLVNRKTEGVPSSMAVIGIPAGLSVQPWQLKSLQEKKLFDYYEIRSNTLFLYYRGLAPSSVAELRLDLKAEVAGEFEGAASSAYLYYTNEHKSWAPGLKVKITS
jgi:alpha-2-macroglobulin-like protein